MDGLGALRRRPIQDELLHLVGHEEADIEGGRGGRRGHKEATPACLSKPATPLPKEAESWDWRECHLWFWSRGMLHPKQNRHAARRHPARKSTVHGQAALDTRQELGLVSVVVPTTEGRQHFHSQVWACFVSQAWPEKELIVIETYSRRPSELFSSLETADERLLFLPFNTSCPPDFRTGTDLSIGAKRNIGQHVAVGDYIVNFDDDDIYAPTYISTLVSEMDRCDADMITLSAWHVFDVTVGQFGYCDPRAWARKNGLSDSDPTVDAWVWGYGFSYVYRRHVALAARVVYPDESMSEDVRFFKSLRAACGADRAALLPDRDGICLHVLHSTNTSESFCLHEVHRDDAQDLEVSDLHEMLSFYLRTYPRVHTGFSSSIHFESREQARPRRRFRDLLVHCASGSSLRLRCPRGSTGREVKELCSKRLNVRAGLLGLYRLPPLSAACPRTASGPGPLDASDRVGLHTTELWLVVPTEREGDALAGESGGGEPGNLQRGSIDDELLLAAAVAYAA
mmetsp:Transcript_108563/g.306885  ORF Transcript_108563/g.306885 Transcript_108563/m.306885 type:complete len:512 (-) Transcript_108563:5-1540(-)